MKGNRLLKIQRAKFLLYNLIAFCAVFFALGLAAVLLINGYFYHAADKELKASREFLTAEISGDTPQRPDYKPDTDGAFVPRNPRIGYLLYNADKELTANNIPDFIDSTAMPKPSESEKFYNQRLDGINFRVLESSFLQDGEETYYIQILINIDGETALRNNIISIYLICLSVIIALAVVLSFLLSGFTMSPVIKGMEKQTEFVSDAAHELRTPLTVLQSRLEQLLGSPDSKVIDKSELISDCLSEAIRLSRLSDSLLTLAKSDADKIPPEPESFDIAELVHKTAAPYVEMAACEGKAFTVSGARLDVKADAKRIMQALIILFDNALKYTVSGDSVSVSVRHVKNKCEIVVADTGIGVSADGLGHIFERFYRDDSSRGVTEGSGLGLAIAKQIIEEHNGIIRAEHNQPKGLRFIIIIPCAL